MPGSGYDAYELAVQSIGLTVPEFVSRAEEAASRRATSERDIDAVIQALADERREELWVGVQAVLEQQLQRESAQPVPAGARALQGRSYQMERMDDHRHRAGFLLSRALRAHATRKPALPFFDWLNSLPELEQVNLLAHDGVASGGRGANTVDELRRLAGAGQTTLLPSEVKMFVRGVAYLDDVARQRYCVRVDAGRLRNAQDEPFDTSGMRTVFSGPAWAIYVQSPATGDFYSGSHLKGEFHHSSFLAGAPVLGAGEWQVRGGELLQISGKSGHYQPEPRHFLGVLESLAQKGLQLDRAQALLFAGNQPAPTSVQAIVQAHRLPDGLTLWATGH